MIVLSWASIGFLLLVRCWGVGHFLPLLGVGQLARFPSIMSCVTLYSLLPVQSHARLSSLPALGFSGAGPSTFLRDLSCAGAVLVLLGGAGAGFSSLVSSFCGCGFLLLSQGFSKVALLIAVLAGANLEPSPALKGMTRPGVAMSCGLLFARLERTPLALDITCPGAVIVARDFAHLGSLLLAPGACLGLLLSPRSVGHLGLSLPNGGARLKAPLPTPGYTCMSSTLSPRAPSYLETLVLVPCSFGAGAPLFLQSCVGPELSLLPFGCLDSLFVAPDLSESFPSLRSLAQIDPPMLVSDSTNSETPLLVQQPTYLGVGLPMSGECKSFQLPVKDFSSSAMSLLLQSFVKLGFSVPTCDCSHTGPSLPAHTRSMDLSILLLGLSRTSFLVLAMGPQLEALPFAQSHSLAGLLVFVFSDGGAGPSLSSQGLSCCDFALLVAGFGLIDILPLVPGIDQSGILLALQGFACAALSAFVWRVGELGSLLSLQRAALGLPLVLFSGRMQDTLPALDCSTVGPLPSTQSFTHLGFALFCSCPDLEFILPTQRFC